MSKEKTNEGIFGAAKRFSDAFFDGLSRNATDKMMKKAKDIRRTRRKRKSPWLGKN